jgi:hypothetical protein
MGGSGGWHEVCGGAALGAGDHSARAVEPGRGRAAWQRGIGEAAPLMCGPGHSAGHLNTFKLGNSIQMNLNLNQTVQISLDPNRMFPYSENSNKIWL